MDVRTAIKDTEAHSVYLLQLYKFVLLRLFVRFVWMEVQRFFVIRFLQLTGGRRGGYPPLSHNTFLLLHISYITKTIIHRSELTCMNIVKKKY
jgi:hypothetical protein